MPPVGASILVVDDDPDILDVLADRLEALDYRVVTASTGRDGLARLEDTGPQLVLLDIALPDMNGLDVLTAMRTQDPDRHRGDDHRLRHGRTRRPGHEAGGL